MKAKELLEQFAGHFLPLRAVTITLRCSRDVELPWFHQARLHAWLRGLLDEQEKKRTPPDTWLRLDTPECGRTHYRSGDLYNFSIICLAPGWDQFQQLLQKLQLTEGKSTDPDQGLAFGSHWTAVDARDLFSDEPVYSAEQLSAADLDYFYAEANLWLSPRAQELCWHWLSPARITLPPEQKKHRRGESRYCRDSSDTSLELLLLRCWDTPARMLRDAKLPAAPRQNPPPCPTSRADIFWIDHQYSNRDGKQTQMGGQLGQVRGSTHLDHDWLALVVLCQYLGLGQRSDFGLGRFRLEGTEGEHTLQRAQPQQTWLARCLEPEALATAWRHVRDNRPAAAERAATDLDIDDEFNEDEDQADAIHVSDILQSRSEHLLARSYDPPPAQAAFLTKADGGLRPLAVPPFWDAVLQRAVAAQLSVAIDSLMYERSYGYRKGRSRHQAAAAIQRARRDGYRWVFDADIEDFFGSVDHLRLQSRLLCLFDDDAVIDAIMGWVRAPVQWQGEEHPRKRGLPQGSSLSPVLANLMLDDFDNDMHAAGMKLVRFADDFVILCRKREHTEKAAQLAAESLQEQGFTLKAAKTGIRDLDEGMDFLGFLFVGDMALDLATNNPKPPKTKQPLHNKQHLALATRWLAKLAGTRPVNLSPEKLFADEADAALNRRDALPVGADQVDAGGVVFVAGEPCSLYTQNRRLVIARDDQRLLERPWAHVTQLLVFGNHHITTPALRAACRAGTTVHLSSVTGRYQACISNNNPGPGGHRLWLSQAVCAEDPAFALEIARRLVASRLRHQREVLRMRKHNPSKTSLSAQLQRIADVSDSEQLNGVEGAASAAYFAALADLIPAAYLFTGRKRRPPPDPTNALLSFGYTLLYGYQDTLLRAHGLHPWTGLYHRGQGNHRALASDLMEPFRHTVEQLVLKLLRANSLPPELFEQQPSGGCLILPPARRRFLVDLGRRMETPVTAIGEEDAYPLRQQMARQIQSLVTAIRARDPELFKAFRAR